MAFDGTEGAPIDLNTAAGWTKTYRVANPNGVHGQFMGKNILNQILSQHGCMGIRVYQAIDDQGNETMVFSGVDANEADQVQGIIADRAKPCPPDCTASALNS